MLFLVTLSGHPQMTWAASLVSLALPSSVFAPSRSMEQEQIQNHETRARVVKSEASAQCMSRKPQNKDFRIVTKEEIPDHYVPSSYFSRICVKMAQRRRLFGDANGAALFATNHILKATSVTVLPSPLIRLSIPSRRLPASKNTTEREDLSV
jgi:hypothetical protein